MRQSPLMRVVIIVLMLAGTALAMPLGDTAGQNQSGDTVNEKATGWQGLCGFHGGTATVDVVRTPASGLVGVTITCNGGFLGGLKCMVDRTSTICTWKQGASLAPGQEPPPGAIDAGSLEPLAELPPGDGSLPAPNFAGQPKLVEAVVSWNPSADAAREQALVQVNGCLMLGGEATIGEDASIIVDCAGGVLNGMLCSFGSGLSMCFFEPGTERQTPETTQPAMTQEQPTEAMPTQAIPPTEPATSPTEAPTVAPTDEPVIEPTFGPTPDTRPGPPLDGELPPLEQVPTPTEAPFN